MSSPAVAALGCVVGLSMVGPGCRSSLAECVSWPAGTALSGQALDRHRMSDVWIYAGGIIFAARPGRSSLALQSLTKFGACFVLYRHCCSCYFCPQCTNQPDEHRTLNRLDFGCRSVFCQLGVRYLLCGVRLASGILTELAYIC